MSQAFIKDPDPEMQADLRATRPFFYVLQVMLLLLYGVTVYTVPEMRAPERFIPFTLLMLLHTALHWFCPTFILNQRRLILYLVVQGGLAFVLTQISQSPGVAMGLYLALVGESTGMLQGRRTAVYAVAAMMALLTVNFILLWGVATLLEWLWIILPMLFFTLVYVVLFLRQMQAREASQALLAELEVAHRQLAQYAQQVETLTLEAERQRMARELHDTLAQGVAGLILQLEALEVHLERGATEQAAAIAGQAKGRARTTLAEARRAIDDLRTQSDEPLVTIEREVERFNVATGIPCVLTTTPELALPPEAGAHAVRCVGEGLANVARHAQASRAEVALTAANGRLQVAIRDDGRGFEPDAVPTGHYGLVGLRERARLLGGQLVIESRPGNGTLLRMELPLHEHKGDQNL